MKAKTLGLLAAGLLEGPMAANAGVIFRLDVPRHCCMHSGGVT